MGLMSNEPPIPMAQREPTPEERAEVVRLAHDLSQKMIMQSVESSTAVALLAAESFIAYRTAGARMPLQEVMDNIRDNVPKMYVAALTAQTTDIKGG